AGGSRGARATGGDQQATGHARHGTLRRAEGGSGLPAAARRLQADGSRRSRRDEAGRGGLGKRRVLRRWREQPVPLARNRLAWISGDRERPHPEWSRRAAARTTSG